MSTIRRQPVLECRLAPHVFNVWVSLSGDELQNQQAVEPARACGLAEVAFSRCHQTGRWADRIAVADGDVRVWSCIITKLRSKPQMFVSQSVWAHALSIWEADGGDVLHQPGGGVEKWII